MRCAVHPTLPSLGLIKLQIGVYHHVTGVDASSSASLAAYINTLTYKENHQSTTKIVEGVYW
jgi:hypothetical protein